MPLHIAATGVLHKKHDVKAEFCKRLTVSSCSSDQEICRVVRVALQQIAKERHWLKHTVTAIDVLGSNGKYKYRITHQQYRKHVQDIKKRESQARPRTKKAPQTTARTTPQTVPLNQANKIAHVAQPAPATLPGNANAAADNIQQDLKADTLDFLYDTAAGVGPRHDAKQAAQSPKAIEDRHVHFLAEQLEHLRPFANNTEPARGIFVVTEPAAAEPPGTPELIYEMPGDFPDSDSDETDFEPLAANMAGDANWWFKGPAVHVPNNFHHVHIPGGYPRFQN